MRNLCMKKIINLLFNDFTNDNRVLKISKSLQNNGYEVTLVATHFDKELPKEDVVEGIKVKRFKVGRIRLLPLNLILFWVSIVRNFRKENIFHCNDLYTLPPAYVIKKFFNKEAKIVYDCHEHETEAGVYIDKPVIKFFAKVFERKMIKEADKVITVSESIADDYVKMYRIEKPSLVLNCPVYKNYPKKDLFRKKFGIGKDKVLFLYQGEYLKGRGVEELVNIFKKIEHENEKLVLILLIYVEKTDIIKEEIKDSKNIYLHEKVSVLEYMEYVSSADWGVFLLKNTCKSYNYSLANKLFDYMMASVPVIVSDLKEMGNFVKEYKVGHVIPEASTSKDIIKLLGKASQEKSEYYQSQLDLVAKRYNWEEQEKVLLKVYKI